MNDPRRSTMAKNSSSSAGALVAELRTPVEGDERGPALCGGLYMYVGDPERDGLKLSVYLDPRTSEVP
ncbi:hypothetical protein [Sorangium sp. So ce131]|uniref:hypothetical protein n=1 Tax=Sorangium sp. So ce131 TaxID=3133282 RepID=UPI003F641A47